MAEDDQAFVSRGGLKLAAALDAFGIDPADSVCADLGCNVGGFTDCLLQRGATRVYAVDTGYGVLAWRLRRDPRVVVLERTNAMHVDLPEPVDLVTIDVAWTRQEHILPAARRLLRPGGSIVTLIKPHYEADVRETGGVLSDEQFDAVSTDVLARLREARYAVEATVESPIRGQAGNRELLALIRIPPTG